MMNPVLSSAAGLHCLQVVFVSGLCNSAVRMLNVKPTFLFSFPGQETSSGSQGQDVVWGAQVLDSPRADTRNSCKLYIGRGIVWRSDMLFPYSVR